MTPNAPGADSTPQPEGDSVTPETETSSLSAPTTPVVIHLPGTVPPVNEQATVNEPHTALQTAKIVFVAVLLITAAVLMVLGFEVGAIVTLFAGVGLLAVELLKRL